ncbi:hydroperoxy fatty acid reductase gpx1 [Ruminiclostridium hungatei]|uniref:Glutathione peroxidase n=1 Tax=Ruminiclostridium hungatei TaxID=48256 RepID=A0A1V4SRV0_RUMHU|nr:glutathione peroxidase [Ruminiclostridium hungatei]OPX46021.1 hydroperoxy fatty acid reductase gpx1 [Ruminiclostridium hungatei]
MNIYDFKAKTIDGREISLDKYKDKVVIIVNTASKCGFTPQYEDLQKLYDKYRDRGVEILGFPSNQFAGQEPGSDEDINNFCTLNYGVDFQMFSKLEVRGPNAHPLFEYLTGQAPFKGFDMTHSLGKKLKGLLEEKFSETLSGDSIKWNFTKFLIDRNGNVAGRYEPTTSPLDMEGEIEKLL